MRPLRSASAVLGLASVLLLAACGTPDAPEEDFEDWAGRMQQTLSEPDADSVAVEVSTQESRLAVLDVACGPTASAPIVVPEGAEVVLEVHETDAMWWVGLNPPA